MGLSVKLVGKNPAQSLRWTADSFEKFLPESVCLSEHKSLKQEGLPVRAANPPLLKTHKRDFSGHKIASINEFSN